MALSYKEGNPVRLIDDFVDGLDLAKAGFIGVAAKLERSRIKERTTRGRADATRLARHCVRSGALTMSAPRRSGS